MAVYCFKQLRLHTKKFSSARSLLFKTFITGKVSVITEHNNLQTVHNSVEELTRNAMNFACKTKPVGLNIKFKNIGQFHKFTSENSRKKKYFSDNTTNSPALSIP